MTPLISAPLVFTRNDLKPGKYFSVLGAGKVSCAAARASRAGEAAAMLSAARCLSASRRSSWSMMGLMVMQNSECRMQKRIAKCGQIPRGAEHAVIAEMSSLRDRKGAGTSFLASAGPKEVGGDYGCPVHRVVTVTGVAGA